MHKFLFFIVGALLFMSPLSAQSKKDIKKHCVSSYVEKEIDYEDGEDKPRVLKEWFYNDNGDLIEYKDWTKSGELENWEKYAYDAEGNLVEKQHYNKSGELKAKTVYTYKNGLLVKKSYYDKKGRLERERIYEYQFHK